MIKNIFQGLILAIILIVKVATIIVVLAITYLAIGLRRLFCGKLKFDPKDDEFFQNYRNTLQQMKVRDAVKKFKDYWQDN